MQLKERRVGNAVVVKPLEKRLDARVAMRLKERMAALIEGGTTGIVLDLSRVEFIDSSGLGAIISSLKRMGGCGDLVISGVRGQVLAMFQLTRMDKVFWLFTDEREALTALVRRADRIG